MRRSAIRSLSPVHRKPRGNRATVPFRAFPQIGPSGSSPPFPCLPPYRQRAEPSLLLFPFGRGMALPGFPLFPSTPGKHRDQEAPDAPPGLRLCFCLSIFASCARTESVLPAPLAVLCAHLRRWPFHEPQTGSRCAPAGLSLPRAIPRNARGRLSGSARWLSPSAAYSSACG